MEPNCKIGIKTLCDGGGEANHPTQSPNTNGIGNVAMTDDEFKQERI